MHDNTACACRWVNYSRHGIYDNDLTLWDPWGVHESGSDGSQVRCQYYQSHLITLPVQEHVEYHLVHDACTDTLNFLLCNCLGFCDCRKLSTLKCESSSGTDCTWECKSCDTGITCVASSSCATDSMFNWTVTITMMKGYEQQIALQSINLLINVWISEVTFSCSFRMAFRFLRSLSILTTFHQWCCESSMLYEEPPGK